jgi:hypothetical protein
MLENAKKTNKLFIIFGLAFAFGRGERRLDVLCYSFLCLLGLLKLFVK